MWAWVGIHTYIHTYRDGFRKGGINLWQVDIEWGKGGRKGGGDHAPSHAELKARPREGRDKP